MTFKIKSLFLFFLLANCEPEKNKKTNDRIDIKFYNRDIGSNNGYYTYSDQLKALDYENDQFTIQQMVASAYRYLDTAKADKPISHITILGQPKGKFLPQPGMKFYGEQVKYILISLAFNSAFKETEKDKRKLISVDLWKNGEAKYSFEDKALDSIIHLNEFVNNKK